jgi:hypothetical protein
MIHENWIPIEMFDLVKYNNQTMVFMDYDPPCDEFPCETIILSTGHCLEAKLEFDNPYFEPTHYLNPTCYKKETL